MANELNELKDYVNEEGRDINVIEKQNEEFYKTRGEPRFKKPKVLVEKTNAEFIELLTPYLDKIKQRLDEIFDIDN